LNNFTYGNFAATSLLTDLLGVDSGSGTLNIAAGNAATVNSGTGAFKLAANTTLVVQGGGTLNVNGPQTHGAGALLSVTSGTANLNTDAGSNLSVATSGNVNLLAVTHHLGGITVNGGVLNVSGGNLIASGNVTNNWSINIASGRIATFSGNVNGSGNYTGTGSAIFSAGFSPGNSPTVVNFGGNMSLTSTSTLNIELGGTVPGFEYDAIHVAGQLSLAGALNVSFINSGTYMPKSGDTFDILDWGTLTGTFLPFALPALPGGLTWDASALYSSGVLKIGGVLGDYNLNGFVDAADYVMWRSEENQSSLLAADGDFNHTVAGGDYGVWRQNFGLVPGGGAPGFDASEVPEPATVLLLFLAIVPNLAWRKVRA